MLDTPEAVVEALRENDERPHGLPRTVTAEELVEAAEVFEKPDVLVTALLELMAAYEFTGEHRKSPVVFARLLKLWDTTPQSFSDWEAHQVFWRFKWVTTSLLQVPEMPLSSVRGWIGQMRERYEAAGHGMQPVAAMGYHVAFHTGTDVADAYDLWATRPRTHLSDCEACETRHFAWHRMSSGDDAGALDIWRPVLGGAQSCTEEPQVSQARALLPLLRVGRVDEARSHHLTGYRRVRGNTGMQEEVGLHLEFCALSRNEGRGLEILAENRPLFEATGAPLAHLEFLTGVEVLAARLVEDGHADTPVAGPPGRSWTAGTLAAHVRSEGDRLAAAFDARNGTSAVGDRRRARLAWRPVLDESLPLGLRTAASPGSVAGQVPEASEAAQASVVAGAGVNVPEDFFELVTEARRLSLAGHPGSDRLWRHVAERFGADDTAHDDRLGPEDLLRAELAEQRAYVLSRENREAESIGELDRATELFERLAMPWHALSTRTRALAWASAFHGTEEDARPGDGTLGRGADALRSALDEALGEAERLKAEVPLTGDTPGETEAEAASGAEPARERVLAYLVVLYAATFAAYHDVQQQLPEAPASVWGRVEERTRTLREEAERLSVPHHQAHAREFVADLALRRGDTVLAEAELRAALQDVEASGRPWRGSRPRALLAQIMISKDEPAEAVELLHRAIADAVRYEDVEFPLAPTYSLLGHASSHLGDTAGAVRHLSEAAARFDQAGEPEAATEVRFQLADVLARGGQQADAVAVLESVLSDEAAPSLDERTTAQARLNLARGLRELEEFLPAAEEFLRLADTVATWEDDRAVHTLVAADAATALAMGGRWETAELAYARAVASHAEAPNPALIAHMMREFARLTMVARDAEGAEAALRYLTEADAVLAAVPEDGEGTEGFASWYESGEVHYRRARVLAEVDRFEEALAEAEAAVAAHERGGPQGELPRAEAVRFAALVEGNGLGRIQEAVGRLTTAAERCRKADLPEAAGILDSLRRDLLARQ
ncbi:MULTISPECIES: hypothetical protein [unclassified Streptomyces]|uniref:hypothetical protein n=1 Tax=unclassified Streptomyces TaxID=2593676 RepID=UPI0006F6CFD5|nr:MULTISPECIES: hypothetical protein [unclassified Streptomyces]KQX46147.1 hypothetical protein ASD33_22655 [Streptomyces sp. Root1304]KRA80932.1 hypothetical protein ASE09_15755 [Streptomyces sp. Root66D1]